VAPGGQAQFTFKAVGNGGYGTYDFKWGKGPTAATATIIKTGTTDSGDDLIINNVKDSDVGTYWAFIKSGVVGDWLPSRPAVLTIGTIRPQITTQPVGRTVAVGSQTSLEVRVIASPDPTFQWYKDNAAIAGATSNVLNFPSVTLNDDGTYYVVVTNSVGSDTSSTAKLTVTTGGTPPQLNVHLPLQ
jgi:hypothetical protein